MSLLSIAPMIDWTYSQFRVVMRLLAPHALLYTEMQTPHAVLYNTSKALLDFKAMEHPLALQLGGSAPALLAQCAEMAQLAGYQEVNYNLGCPSDRVQAGRFGACLMGEPELAVANIKAMKSVLTIPLTAKTRIGIDTQDSYAFFHAFASRLIEAGCDKLIVHARKAWLNGLNPKQNRTIPPIHYEYVYRLKEDFPEIPIIINGHIQDVEEVKTHMQYVDGVMVGRLACQNPFALSAMHHYFYPESRIVKRTEVMSQYLLLIKEHVEKGVPYSILLKPIMSLAHGLAGAKQWKGLLMTAQKEKILSPLEEACQWLELADA